MKIFVTGATGFLGTHLCKALKSQDNQVVAVGSTDCDLTNSSSLEKFDHLQFDLIFHLAAWRRGEEFCIHHAGEQWIINQKINTNLLTWWSEHQPQAKLICIGSNKAYDPSLPFSEDYYFQGTPPKSHFTYGMTKRMLLNGLESVSEQYGHSYLYVIPPTLYGPFYPNDARQMHFIYDLAMKLLKKEEVRLCNTRIELMHVRDFVQILIPLCKIARNTAINIGLDRDYSTCELAMLLCEMTDYPFEKISFNEPKGCCPLPKLLDTTKLKQFFSNLPFTPLEVGLEEKCQCVKEMLLSSQQLQKRLQNESKCMSLKAPD